MNLATGAEVLGIDIGGANLKLASATGESLSCNFSMWTEHHRLGSRLHEMIGEFSASTHRLYDSLAVTMTGEMADCFSSRRHGVHSILAQVAKAFSVSQTYVYAVGGRWLTPQAAGNLPWSVASSNWYALADWCVRNPAIRELHVDIVLDIGSTTVDVLPLVENAVATAAQTDRQRLQLGQLVYTGVGRTPVAAIVRSLVIGDAEIPVVAEKFATSDDAYLILGLTAEAADDCATADGYPRTIAHAAQRLARMIGEDSERLASSELEGMARQVIRAQAGTIATAMVRNISAAVHCSGRCVRVLVSGHGAALAREIQRVVPFAVELLWLDELYQQSGGTKAGATRCAPAVAVAWLLANQSSPPEPNP